MPVPGIIVDLVQRFDQHRDAYRSGEYNETQLRREFLDPFFEALGWDVFNLNKEGYAEAYKDVIHEDAIKVGGATNMLSPHGQLAVAKTPAEKTLLQRQIDALVYELYGLTDEEIRIVEGG